ncbi:MAG: penicillin-binding protein 2 [Thermomicrobiales bacterium]|nr:penicillin-binding protein 2 [Thermomicrobiales bacterium]
MTTELLWAIGLWAAVVVAGSFFALRQRGRRVEPVSRNLPFVAVGLLATLAALAVQASRIQVFQQRTYANRSGADPNTGEVTANSRLVVGDTRQMRGSILDGVGRELAWSEDLDPLVQRRYTAPEVAHVTGFFSPLLYGKEGIELDADDALRNGTRRGIAEQLAGVFSIGSLDPEDVQLTIWSGLQQEAQEALAGRIGAAVIVDVRTGAVRAMASYPFVDPGQLAAVRQADVPAARAYWDTLLADDRRPLLRRSTLGLYTPGSIFKVITAAAAIDSGIADPGTIYIDDGVFTVDGHTIIEANRPDDTIIEWTLTEGLAYSLNVVFAQIGIDLGPETLNRYAEAFGFGEVPPFEYPVARSQVASSDDFIGQPAALADTAFGQGELQTTAVHMVLVAQAIANGGVMLEPRLIDRYLDRDGATRHVVPSRTWSQPVAAATASAVEEMMVVAVESGYASAAFVPGLRIGGKTGTAEVHDGEPHAWFIGFGGVDRPEFAVAVVFEHGGSGGSVASAVGGQLLASAIARQAQLSASAT